MGSDFHVQVLQGMLPFFSFPGPTVFETHRHQEADHCGLKSLFWMDGMIHIYRFIQKIPIWWYIEDKYFSIFHGAWLFEAVAFYCVPFPAFESVWCIICNSKKKKSAPKLCSMSWFLGSLLVLFFLLISVLSCFVVFEWVLNQAFYSSQQRNNLKVLPQHF